MDTDKCYSNKTTIIEMGTSFSLGQYIKQYTILQSSENHKDSIVNRFVMCVFKKLPKLKYRQIMYFKMQISTQVGKKANFLNHQGIYIHN